MKFGIITIFPKMFDAIKNYGILGKAIKNNIIYIDIYNIKKNNSKSRIDFKPYGGGKGLVINAVSIKRLIDKAKDDLGYKSKVIYFSPQGDLLNNFFIQKNFLNKNNNFIIICGRYKGIDERIIQSEIDYEISIGDYVISGGELASMIFIDSISRFIPGVIKNKCSYLTDSFMYKNIFDYPNYTKPRVFNNIKVPNVLLSGNHKLISRWRLKQSLGKTWFKRKDLININKLNNYEIELLHEYINDFIKKKYKYKINYEY